MINLKAEVESYFQMDPFIMVIGFKVNITERGFIIVKTKSNLVVNGKKVRKKVVLKNSKYKMIRAMKLSMQN